MELTRLWIFVTIRSTVRSNGSSSEERKSIIDEDAEHDIYLPKSSSCSHISDRVPSFFQTYSCLPNHFL